MKSNLINLQNSEKRIIADIVRVLITGIQQGNSIWIAGNGGSSATADHFEVDLLRIRDLESKTRKINVFSLCSNSALISAIGNDLGFERIFDVQLERKANKGDLCILISASGNSPNLRSAAKYCRRNGILTIGIIGFRNAELSEDLSINLNLGLDSGQYAEAENRHLAICHEIASQCHLILNDELKASSVNNI